MQANNNKPYKLKKKKIKIEHIKYSIKIAGVTNTKFKKVLFEYIEKSMSQ